MFIVSVCVWYFSLVIWYLVPFLIYFVCEFENCTVHTSFRCVLGYAAGDVWWCPVCRLKHYCSVCVVCGGVTNIFKNTNVRIAFRCRNTIAKIIRPLKDHDIPPHNKWGIYQIKCNTWGLLFRMYLMCSRKRMFRLRLVCPTYDLQHVLHFI